MICGKFSYSNQAEAARAMARTVSRTKKSSTGRNKPVVYRCAECGQFHWGNILVKKRSDPTRRRRWEAREIEAEL
jgi:hypothetical protein